MVLLVSVHLATAAPVPSHIRGDVRGGILVVLAQQRVQLAVVALEVLDLCVQLIDLCAKCVFLVSKVFLF